MNRGKRSNLEVVNPKIAIPPRQGRADRIYQVGSSTRKSHTKEAVCFIQMNEADSLFCM
jgi:hypothetical protein